MHVCDVVVLVELECEHAQFQVLHDNIVGASLDAHDLKIVWLGNFQIRFFHCVDVCQRTEGQAGIDSAVKPIDVDVVFRGWRSELVIWNIVYQESLLIVYVIQGLS